MDVKKAISFLKNSVTRDSGFSPVFIANMDIVIGYVEERLRDRWIPVSERLPEVRQHESGEPIEFIVMIRDAVVPTALSIDDNGNWFDFISSYHDMPEYLSDNYDVVAWKPLPEPYKEEI